MRDTVAEARIVFAEELRRAVRNRIWRIITVLVPAILLVLLIVVPIIRSIAGDDDEPKPIGYVSGELSARIPHLAQTSDAVNRQLSCFSSRYMNLLAVFQI